MKKYIFYIILTIALMGASSFITYMLVDNKNDEVETSKEKENNSEVKEESVPQENPGSEYDENDKYFYTETVKKELNKKSVEVEFKFYYDELVSTDYVYYDVFVNGTLYEPTSKLNNFITIVDENYQVSDVSVDKLKEYINDALIYMKNSFGIITTDKEYLYFKGYSLSPVGGPGVDIYVVNENGGVLTSNTLSLSGQGISDAFGCHYEYYKGNNEFYEDSDSSYYVAENAIYYLELADCDGKTNEYKITIKNDTVTKDLITTCNALGSGVC